MSVTPVQLGLSGGERRSIGKAFDVAEEVLSNPDLLPEIMIEFAPTDQWEVREQMSKAIPQLDLNSSEVEEAHQIFESYLRDKSSIVRTCANQGLFDLLKYDPNRETEFGYRVTGYPLPTSKT